MLWNINWYASKVLTEDLFLGKLTLKVEILKGILNHL